MLNRLRAVFASLQAHEVRYVTIGGIAAVLYGVPRATFDLDILIEASPDNADRLLAALKEAGLGTADLITSGDLLKETITVFNDRVRIDVQTQTPGITFEQAWKNRQTMSYQNQAFFVLDRTDLIAAKKAAGRPVDLEDVRALELDGSDAG